MNFFSIDFFCFFLLVLFIYFIVPNKYQNFILLISSSFFISTFSFKFLVYTFIFIVLNYTSILLLEKYRSKPNIRKVICNAGILLNIGCLVYFKYLGFIIDAISRVLHIAGFSSPTILVNIAIPVGISYYTFQGISYILQVYRVSEYVEKNFIVFANYFIFFPKFLAGPIELSKNLIPQLKIYKSFNNPEFVAGLRLILWGAFKKMIIADRLALIVNGVYSDPNAYSGKLLLFTFLLQPLQIYCDFSGYTDIALGIGRAFGIKLTNNFKRPFFSTSVTTFWQRWHISLTSWCNEFIFRRISHKKRKWGIWASVYGVFVTFLIIGVWHGPRWNFIILGILQGIAINYEYFTKKTRLRIAGKLPDYFVLYSSYILTYLFFCFTLIFFNSSTVSGAFTFISNLVHPDSLSGLSIKMITSLDKYFLLFSLPILFIIEYRQELGRNIFDEIDLWPKWIRAGCYYILCFLIIYFGSPYKEFVYMKF